MCTVPSLTLKQAVEQVLTDLDGPLPIDEFCRRVLVVRPSPAKNPVASVRNHLRWEEAGQTLVFLDDRTVIPIAVALRGVRFRIALTALEMARGALCVYPGFSGFLRRGLDLSALRLLDVGGHPLLTRLVNLAPKAKGALGPAMENREAFDLREWFRTQRIQRGDHVLVTIHDWTQGTFGLEHEPVAHRHTKKMARQDREMADTLFTMLEAARDEWLYASEAVTTAYARLLDPRGYPGSPWVEVVAHDPRIKYDGWRIGYPENRSPLERAFLEQKVAPEVRFSRAEGQQVYRFKAALAHQRSLWRTVEIQGKQTLAELDAILRDGFEHDHWDHLGGFWRRVRRGQGKRFREVDLGTVNPAGEGEGAGRRIAGFGLQSGDELTYVYDFGDWVEHRLTLQGIAEPDPEARYPRIVARNRPKYQPCGSCLA